MADVRCAGADAAIECHMPGTHPEETMWLLLIALDDIEAKSDEVDESTAIGNERATASWRDKDGQQITEHKSKPPRNADSFPAVLKAVGQLRSPPRRRGQRSLES